MSDDEEDEIDRSQLPDDWREKLEIARAQFRRHNPSHPPELDKYWPSERAMKYRVWTCQRAETMRQKFHSAQSGPAERQQTPPQDAAQKQPPATHANGLSSS